MIFASPSLQTSKLSVREDRSGFSSPAWFAQVSTEQGGEVEGGGGAEEEGVGRVRLGHEGVGGESQVGKVGGQGGIGVLCQGSHQAPLLHREVKKYSERDNNPPGQHYPGLTWQDLPGKTLVLAALESHSFLLFEATKFPISQMSVIFFYWPCSIASERSDTGEHIPETWFVYILHKYYPYSVHVRF